MKYTDLRALHELTHAYDDWQSRGKYTSNTRTSLYQKTPRDDPQHRQVYMTQPHEVNAHFREYLGSLIPERYSSWNDFLHDFRAEFHELNDLPIDIQKRMLRRLATFWHDMRSNT